MSGKGEATFSVEERELLVRHDQQIETLEKEIEKRVTKAELGPIRAVAYGLIALVMTAVVGAVMTLILKGGVT